MKKSTAQFIYEWVSGTTRYRLVCYPCARGPAAQYTMEYKKTDALGADSWRQMTGVFSRVLCDGIKAAVQEQERAKKRARWDKAERL